MSYNIHSEHCKILGEINLTLGDTFIDELKFYHETEHRRLKMFYSKGTKCANPKCDKIGTKLVVNELTSKNGSKHVHVDIFTDDYQMMTVDHIIPLSIGGPRLALNNLQPMCSKCNSKKGNKLVK